MDTLSLDHAVLTTPGVTGSDLRHAALAEADRLVATVGADPRAQVAALHQRLVDQGLLGKDEVDVLARIGEIGAGVDGGKVPATQAYLEVRRHLDELVASGTASPLALALAAGAVGTYEVGYDEGTGTMAVARTGGEWETRGGLAGAALGGIWGPIGAVVGGVVGGYVGHQLDKCEKS